MSAGVLSQAPSLDRLLERPSLPREVVEEVMRPSEARWEAPPSVLWQGSTDPKDRVGIPTGVDRGIFLITVGYTATIGPKTSVRRKRTESSPLNKQEPGELQSKKPENEDVLGGIEKELSSDTRMCQTGVLSFFIDCFFSFWYPHFVEE